MKKRSDLIWGLCAPVLASMLFVSCHVFRETTYDMMMESVVDPKTGKRVFVRPQEGQPYGVDVGGIYKARKEAKKQKKMEWMENGPNQP